MEAGAQKANQRQRRLERILLGAAPTSAFLLVLQASTPLEGGLSFPVWINAILCAAVFFLLVFFLLHGESDERALAFLGFLSLCHLMGVPDLWSAPTEMERASALARVLSTTFGPIAWIGLLHSMSLLGIAFLSARSLMRLASFERVEQRWAKVGAYSVGAVIGLVGLRALIGYVSGSTSLLP